VTGADEEQKRRAERARRIGLFRYELIQDVIDPALSTRQRGRRARELAGIEHAGPFGEKIRLSRNTIDRWARWYRSGGFDALVPQPAVVQVVSADQAAGPARPASPASLVPAARSAARSEPASVRMVQVQLPDLESPSSAKGLTTDDGPIFQSMFRTERSGALSDTVRELWSGGDAAASTRRVAAATGENPGVPTDLSTFQKNSVINGGRRTGT